MFKKITLALLLTITSTFASQINWAKDFKSGLEIAKTADKPVVFVFSRHTCRYCVILDETTLSDAKVAEALNKDFVSVISYTDENDYTPDELWRPGTPTIWFLLPNGEPMFQPIMGAIGSEDFLNALEIVKEEYVKVYKGKK